MRISLQRRQDVHKYLNTPKSERMNLTEFRKSVHISVSDFKIIREDWLAEQSLVRRDTKQLAYLRRQIDNFHPLSNSTASTITAIKDMTTMQEIEESAEGDFDFEKEMYDLLPEIVKQAKKEIKVGKVNAMELVLRALGKFKDKPAEANEKIDGRNLTILILRADRELADSNGGVAQVSEKPTLLPLDLCEITGQEQPEND